MIAYLEKYNKLPKELRDKMSDRAVVDAIEKLEKKYGISLAKVIIEIMIKEVKPDELKNGLAAMGLAISQTEELAGELKTQVFGGVSDYLGINTFEKINKEAERDLAIWNSQPIAKQINSLEKIDEQTAAKLSKGANFFFSPDDEREIREISKKISDSYPSAGSEEQKDQIEIKTEKIIESAKINFGSEALLERFKQIIRTYLKGIRDRIITKQTLIKPFDSGGLGFDEESADKLLKLADELNKNFSHIPAKIAKVEEIKKPVVRDFNYDLSKELKSRDVKSILEKIDISHEIAPPHPALVKSVQPRQTPADVPAMSAVEEPVKSDIREENETPPPVSMLNRLRNKIAPREKNGEEKSKEPEKALEPMINKVESVPVFAAPAPIVNSGKIKMEDVRAVPKAFGPIEELKYMDLTGFRRMAPPSDIGKKIKEKIDLLEEDSYAKKMEGIKAWRSNPINKIYLEMGQASIGEHRPISDIIKERSANGPEYLTEEEFSAVMDLNRELRF